MAALNKVFVFLASYCNCFKCLQCNQAYEVVITHFSIESPRLGKKIVTLNSQHSVNSKGPSGNIMLIFRPIILFWVTARIV